MSAAAPASAPPRVPRLDPFYFAGRSGALYGCYHRPATPTQRRMGVVLVHPFGHESIQFHRVLRRLALLLSDAGFAVLRFDLSGCGNSAGEEDEWALDAWKDDLGAAAGQLRERASVASVGVVGLRLGGSVALRHAVASGDMDALVLWDPVVHGAAYLEEIGRAHLDMLRHAHVLQDRGDRRREVLGFLLPDAFRDEIDSMGLDEVARRPAGRVLLIESNPAAGQRALQSHLEQLGSDVDLRIFANPHLWLWIEDFAKVHVPLEILHCVVDWLENECP